MVDIHRSGIFSRSLDGIADSAQINVAFPQNKDKQAVKQTSQIPDPLARSDQVFRHDLF